MLVFKKSSCRPSPRSRRGSAPGRPPPYQTTSSIYYMYSAFRKTCIRLILFSIPFFDFSPSSLILIKYLNKIKNKNKIRAVVLPVDNLEAGGDHLGQVEQVQRHTVQLQGCICNDKIKTYTKTHIQLYCMYMGVMINQKQVQRHTVQLQGCICNDKIKTYTETHDPTVLYVYGCGDKLEIGTETHSPTEGVYNDKIKKNIQRHTIQLYCIGV